MKTVTRTALLLSTVWLTACEKPVTFAPTASPAEVAAEQQVQQRLVEQAQAQGPRNNWKPREDLSRRFEVVGTRVARAGAQICQELGLPQQGRACTYHFRIEDKPELNAYADGESVVIFAGMLQFMENDEELATVLAHEFAHNLMSHPASTQKNAAAGMLLGLAADTVAKSQGMDTGGRLAQFGANTGVLRYSVPFEQEADYVGLYIMDRAGFNIKLAPMLWRRMSLENPQGIYNRTTHPTNAERYVALSKTINEITS
ncbi:MAG: M48 family metalloprotease, partial [Rickettsiales bacterium]|nr:M48 family metalloprotease [Rickettsiales bacterium]